MSKERLKYTSDHDALTELPNRRIFEDRLGQSLVNAKRRNVKLGVMFLSLDRFKKINESLGHTAGDLLLQIVAKRLSEALPEYDTVARWGGDEFVFILRDAEQVLNIINTAAKMINRLAEPFAIENQGALPDSKYWYRHLSFVGRRCKNHNAGGRYRHEKVEGGWWE